MADIATLGLEIQSGSVTRARRELDSLTTAGRRAQASADGVSTAFAGFSRFLGPVSAIGAAVAVGGRQALLTADAYTSLSARLALVTSGGGELLRVQQALFEQAQRTRTEFGATADLYGALARSTQSLGVSQERLLGVTETINRALVVSGTSASSAQAALMQLGQGFASGTLRGEELNSVLEQTPRLAQAIADGLGVSIGELRKLGQEGKLTADAVFGALERAGASVRAEFARMPTTIGQAMTQVANSTGGLVAAIDQLSGTSSLIARFVSQSSANLDGLTESIRRNGSVLGGFASNLERVFATRLSRNLSDQLSYEVGRLEELRQQQAQSGGGLFIDSMVRDAEGRVASLTRQAQAANDQLKALAGTSASLGQARRPANEGGGTYTDRLFGNPDPEPKKPGRSAFAEELAARRERISLLTVESEVERTAVQISIGAYGQLSQAQREQLLALAAAEDARMSGIGALEREAEERRKLSAISERMTEAARSETERLIEGNATLRQEIELIGATEQARAVIEQSRIRAARILAEEALAKRALNGASLEELTYMRQQIELLTQREALVGQRAATIQNNEARREANAFNVQVEADLRSSLERGLSAAFAAAGGNPLSAFVEEMERAVFSHVSRALIDALLTKDVISGFLSFITGQGGGFGGGGGFNPFGGSGTNGAPDFDIYGRAFGGPVRRGSLVEVNEQGTELLTLGGRDFLMAGADGYVTPAGRSGIAGAGRQVSMSNAPTINVYGSNDPAAVRREVAAALEENNRQWARMLSERGVL